MYIHTDPDDMCNFRKNRLKKALVYYHNCQFKTKTNKTNKQANTNQTPLLLLLFLMSGEQD